MGGDRRGGRRKESVSLHQPSRDTKTAQYWPPATDAAPPPPAGSDDVSAN